MKLCKDCTYFETLYRGCARLDPNRPRRIDYIFGNEEDMSIKRAEGYVAHSADGNRRDESKCGRGAKWFEPK